MSKIVLVMLVMLSVSAQGVWGQGETKEIQVGDVVFGRTTNVLTDSIIGDYVIIRDAKSAYRLMLVCVDKKKSYAIMALPETPYNLQLEVRIRFDKKTAQGPFAASHLLPVSGPKFGWFVNEARRASKVAVVLGVENASETYVYSLRGITRALSMTRCK